MKKIVLIALILLVVPAISELATHLTLYNFSPSTTSKGITDAKLGTI